ncbi:uncharacterized protein LOC141822842 [Curcuma longa]|uniref:uncharacterized protein LOC141822842 n=1 Tax=Curcuma longa TaxID=136217 RepID=UPI003D9E89A1
MKALLCLQAAVPAVICAPKANIGAGFGLLGRCRSLSFSRSTGPFSRAPLCSCSVKPPTSNTPTTPSEGSDGDQDDNQERAVPIAEVDNSWMEPWEVLLDHIFAPPNKLEVQLLDPVSELLQGLEIGHQEYNALLALVQVYFNLKDYEKAKAINSRIQNFKEHSGVGSRLHLIEAILNLTLAVEKLRQGKLTGSDKELESLIENAEKSWGFYKKLEEEGFGIRGPPVDE